MCTKLSLYWAPQHHSLAFSVFSDQGVWKSSAPSSARWSRKFELNEWMKKTFWASYFVLKPKIFFRCPVSDIDEWSNKVWWAVCNKRKLLHVLCLKNYRSFKLISSHYLHETMGGCGSYFISLRTYDMDFKFMNTLPEPMLTQIYVTTVVSFGHN